MNSKKEPKSEERKCFCPYCEQELFISALPYCQACGITVFYCPECRQPLPRDSKACPHCGIEINYNEDI